MRALVAALGHPEGSFPSVLIAGTNGKGSTSATLASILRYAGYRTGLYTSPHLISVNERIQLNGTPISDVGFAEVYDIVNQTASRLMAKVDLKAHPSFFETITAMAFEYFARSRVAIAVLEVGMGGRLDATNVVEPIISVITDIALDHQQFLGNTITEIAREKAAIIRGKGIVVTLPQHPEANEVIGRVAMERRAQAISAAEQNVGLGFLSSRYMQCVSRLEAKWLQGRRTSEHCWVQIQDIIFFWQQQLHAGTAVIIADGVDLQFNTSLICGWRSNRRK